MRSFDATHNLVDSFDGWLTQRVNSRIRDTAEVDSAADGMINMVGLAQPLVRFQQGTAALLAFSHITPIDDITFLVI